ncbi:MULTISPECIES: NrsF family protein, partial [Burkholderia]
MKTDELISMLATGVTPVDPHLPAKRFATAVAIGAGGALLLMLAVLGLRHDLATVAQTPLFWAKVALPLAIAIGALRGALRLARP